MDKPQEAILVKGIVAGEERTLVCTDKIQKLKDDAERLREINADISAKLKKFEIPQGPAFIYGRWEWPPPLTNSFCDFVSITPGGYLQESPPPFLKTFNIFNYL